MSVPSVKDVEVAISQLECDEKEATAIRKFYDRERKHPKVTGKMLAEAFWWAFLLLAMGWVTYAVVAAAFDWLLGGMGAR